RRLAALPLPAVLATKGLLNGARRDAVNAACARERAAALAFYTSPEFQAALTRFDKTGRTAAPDR
ncbi:MAG TPA: hypothetical protein VFS16_16645, partial [Acidimicrobiia bacterium]|nr:hypothetical protein [Acidimicrobiia bacterium]